MASITEESKNITEKELSDLEITLEIKDDLRKYAEYKDLSFIRGVNGFYNEAYSFETNELCKKYGQSYCMVENDLTELLDTSYVEKLCILKAFYGKGYLDKKEYTFGDLESYADRLYMIVYHKQKHYGCNIYVYEYNVQYTN